MTILMDDRISVIVGLDKNGQVAQVFADIDGALENAEPEVVSIGHIEAIPLDYDELFNVPKEEADERGGQAELGHAQQILL